MRDEHRPKQELVHEIAGLRKQVIDLKEAMMARRRVEDALRAAEELLRTLTDTAPVGLCLFRRDGTFLTSNRPFARMLGYDSAAELQAVGGVLGIFANSDERSCAFWPSEADRFHHASFRRKDGCPRLHATLAADSPAQDIVALVVFNHPTED